MMALLVIVIIVVASIAGGAYLALFSHHSGTATTIPATQTGSSTTQGATTVRVEGTNTTVTVQILPEASSAEGGGSYSSGSGESITMLYQYILANGGEMIYFAGFVNTGTATIENITISVGDVFSDSITVPVPPGSFAWGPNEYGATFGETEVSSAGSGPFPVSLVVQYADGTVGRYNAGSLSPEVENIGAPALAPDLYLYPSVHTYLGALQNGSGAMALNLAVDTNETYGLTAVLTGNGQTITVPLREIPSSLSEWNSCNGCVVEGSTTGFIQGLKVGAVYQLTILSQYSYFSSSGNGLSNTVAWPMGLIRVAPYNSSALTWPPVNVATTTCDTNISRCGV